MPRPSFSLRGVIWLVLVLGIACTLTVLAQSTTLPDYPPWARDAIAKHQPSVVATLGTIIGGAFVIWAIGYVIDRVLGVGGGRG